MGHLDKHHIQVDFQHEFRCRSSCDIQLLITSHDSASSLSKHSQTDVAILDFSKAFDRVRHHCLTLKPQYLAECFFILFYVLINVLLQKHVSYVFIIGINNVVSIDIITVVWISCYDYDAQTDAQLT